MFKLFNFRTLCCADARNQCGIAASGVVQSHVRRLVFSTTGLLTPTVAHGPVQMWQDSPAPGQQLLLLLPQLLLWQQVQYMNILTDNQLTFCTDCAATNEIYFDRVTTPGTTIVKACCLSTNTCKAVNGAEPYTCQAI